MCRELFCVNILFITLKEWFIINSDNNMNYTEDMEKAMSKNHRMSIAEYESNLSKRMEVELKREKEYQESKQIIAEVDSQLHR